MKSGFNSFRNHIINISLKPTNYWVNGTINILGNQYFYNINSSIPNVIKQIKYNNKPGCALLLNNNVIYESTELFSYDVSLILLQTNFSKKNIYNFIDYECVEL
jgi:hypothetical protein